MGLGADSQKEMSLQMGGFFWGVHVHEAVAKLSFLARNKTEAQQPPKVRLTTQSGFNYPKWV